MQHLRVVAVMEFGMIKKRSIKNTVPLRESLTCVKVLLAFIVDFNAYVIRSNINAFSLF